MKDRTLRKLLKALKYMNLKPSLHPLFNTTNPRTCESRLLRMYNQDPITVHPIANRAPNL